MNNLNIDLHGLNRDDARKKLHNFLSAAPKTADRVTVIHGDTGGTVLRDMTRKMYHPRIWEITPKFADDGITYLYLKK